jgi:flavin-dependent thymidylate synthase
MKVSLLSYTPDALDLLLRTKGTRLAHGSDPATWTQEQKDDHLAYMKDTIKSSWEFVDYTFRIEGVTRAFTHQLVRTRTGSYAQEAMRVIDARDHEVAKPLSLGKDAEVWKLWDEAIIGVLDIYGRLIDRGVPAQDARGLLPTNITTSIMAKFNLRTLHEMAKLRLCTRTQGEYQDVFREMRRLVQDAHPWVEAHGFLEVHCAATGSCAFPRYGAKECPVWFPELDNEAVKKQALTRFWGSARFEASPAAKDGKAM